MIAEITSTAAEPGHSSGRLAAPLSGADVMRLGLLYGNH